ncbi:4Fe-4S binding protein [Pelobacter propionicus]|uniref:4Fe-4S ferredoxin, iron-sulfur binding domain protein n=1 Tax=Pelobacter propionicus (strain DSM 2379 / NBRC 103807 / OttBd1) TaxID=338966 RepID=A1ANH7_PELPD|nr:4Fe-4S binding protein [Pelobacter propionicus]ABK98897.1 4Fe-4S ferredoxin, iron-sulfur binding domain protein [Pelobacter propionicus DSM 2379]
MNINSVRLIYFSPTHTTKRVLEAIARSFPEAAVEQYDLTLPGARLPEETAGEGVLTIFGAPVYGGRLPAQARERLRLVRGGGMAVVVVLYGNREFEDALLELWDLAQELGYIPIAGGAFIGEHSFSTPEVPVAAGRPDTADLEAAAEFGRRIGKKARRLTGLDLVPSLEVPGDSPYREWKGLSIPPETDASLCIRCGTCVRICPTAAISSGVGMPTDLVACIACCACVRECPTGARVMRDERIREKAVWLNEKCAERKEPQTFV